MFKLKFNGLFFFLCVQVFAFSQQPSFENFKVENSLYLQFNDIIDYQGEILFITNEGVYVWKRNKIKQLIQKQNLVGFVSTNEALYVWTIYGEIYKKTGLELAPMEFNNVLSKRLQNKIINTVIFSENSFYVSTTVGDVLLQIDLEKETIENVSANNQYPYYVNRFDTGLISGTNQIGVNKELYVNVADSSFTITLADNTTLSKTNIIPLEDGTFVFTKQHEVIRFDKVKSLNRMFMEKNIENVFQDSEGKIWFTMNNGGVSCYADGNFQASNSIRYLGNKTVVSIAEDHQGNIWFGTAGNGIYLLKKTIQTEYSSPQVFSSTNTKNESIRSSYIIDELPVLGGYSSNVIRTDNIFDTIAPIVFINNIKINGVDTTTLNFYELSHDQNNLELNISGYLNDNSELQYKYILEGKEKEWNYSVKTNVYYSSLIPGSYTFKVFAMSDNGSWSKVPAVVTFNIAQPIWTSLWFITSFVLLIIAIILVIIFLWSKRLQQKDKILEAEKRKVLISELHALRSQMNPHFIFNTLSSIQSFITKNENKGAISYLSKFAKLMRATLENTKKQKISIKDEIETLDLYLQLEQLRLNHKFDYSFEIDEELDTQFDEIPSMLIQPYVENAIWHGMSNNTRHGKIIITFSLQNENMLKCAIQDNGIGRKKAMELKKQQHKSPSYGMSITKERLEILNSLQNSSFNLNIVDLTENNIPSGTLIELFIPLD